MKWKEYNWIGLIVYVIYPIAMLAVIIGTAVLLFKTCCTAPEPEGTDAVTVRVDTLRDTVFVAQPVAVTDTVVRWLCVYVKRDSTGLLSPIEDNTPDSTGLPHGNTDGKPELTDSAFLMLPISQKTYTDDSTYTAWVSGYEAQLDSIRFYRNTIFKTVTKTRQKRWNWGVQGGIYLTPKGLQPGFGGGVTYTW